MMPELVTNADQHARRCPPDRATAQSKDNRLQADSKKMLITLLVLHILIGNPVNGIEFAGCPQIPNAVIRLDNPLLIGPRRPEAHIVVGPPPMSVSITDEDHRGATVRASRHHVIPYQTLRSFFNAVIRRSTRHVDELRELGRGLLNIITYGQNIYDRYGNRQPRVTRELLEAAQRFTTRMRDGEVTASSVFTNYEINTVIPTIHTLFLWMPGNIFIAPTNEHRLDDPGNAFEHRAASVVGHANHQVLFDLYTAMCEYINRENSPNDYLDGCTPQEFSHIMHLLARIPASITLFNFRRWSNTADVSGNAQVQIAWVEDTETIPMKYEEQKGRRSKREDTCAIDAIITMPFVKDPFCIVTPVLFTMYVVTVI